MPPATSPTHIVSSKLDAVFHHGYGVDAPDLRRLYENAKRDQWNATRDVPWGEPLDPDRGIIADELIDVYGTPYWERLGARERVELNRRVSAWRLSLLVYGEHGAMLVCSQLVEAVTGSDAKLFQATQVMDEARHTEVLSRYIEERLGGLMYPMPANERALFDTLLGDKRWPLKTVGLQLVAETFAVSLFRMLAETSVDPLLKEICRRILQDEARHMGFGMLSLPEVVGEMTEAERWEIEDFTAWSLEKTLTGLFPEDVYRELGFGTAEIAEIKRLRRERATGGESSLFRRLFKRELHGSLVQNLARIGLLTERVEPRLASLGIRIPTESA